MKALTSAVCAFLVLCASPLSAQTTDETGIVLKFPDGRDSLSVLSEINLVLRSVGVRLSRIELPESARPLLEASAGRPLSPEESDRILETFSMSRQVVLDQARVAGRDPVVPGGGSMTSGEAGVPPYPKVYDLKAMRPYDRLAARDKFGRLHVNSTDSGVGVDEVMTLVAGGPWRWYFLLADAAVVELRIPRVDPAGAGWRLSYPGLTPHGGHFLAEDGLCIAYITGPTAWTMRYKAPGLPGETMLGKNPWIDFETD
jgi:hypothetical protein